MNRMEEYHNLMQELNQPVPELEHTFDRAHRKVVRRKREIRSATNIAAVLFILVGLVNLSEPIATACSKLPILRELAEAVTFSDSLSDAVANEYVQMLSLSQTDNNITVTIEYLIVDQKQVNVFFRLDSDAYADLQAVPTVLSAEGEPNIMCHYHLNDWPVNGELQSMTIDYLDENVPNSLALELNIQDVSDSETVIHPGTSLAHEELFKDTEHIAQFNFLLEFDPALKATAKVYPINQTVIIDGTEITFTDMEVYPSHLRVNTKDCFNGAEWLNNLYFYIKTGDGTKFDSPNLGLSANGTRNSDEMTSTMAFRSDSPYFYTAKEFEIVITGALWQNKDMQQVFREWIAEEPIHIIVK